MKTEARLRGRTEEELIEEILSSVPVPQNEGQRDKVRGIIWVLLRFVAFVPLHLCAFITVQSPNLRVTYERVMNQSDHITFKDKSGRSYSVGNGNATDRSLIMDMYRVFSPKPASQGLPPADPETCEKWVTDILDIGDKHSCTQRRRDHRPRSPDSWMVTGGQASSSSLFTRTAATWVWEQNSPNGPFNGQWISGFSPSG